MSTTPEPDADLADLRAERDAWQARALEAERLAEQLAEQVVELRATGPADGASLSVFDARTPTTSRRGLAPDGTDPRLVSFTLGAVGLVAAMVLALSLLNNGLFSVFTVVMLVLTAALLWTAWQLRFVRPDVSVVKHMVLVTHKGETQRFDLSSEATRVDVQGRPGDPDWCVRLRRRGGASFTVDDTMLNAHAFTDALHEYRPDL